MTMSLATFVEQYPEFASVAGTNAAFVQAKLDDAALELDATVLGAEYDKAQALTAATMLAESPFGQQAGLRDKDGNIVYAARLEKMIERKGLAYRVVLE